MYAACTGRAPFRAETSYGILRRITDVEPRAIGDINPGIPDWLAAVIGRLHAKDPEERFPTAAATADVLEQCLAHVQQPATVPLPAPLGGGKSRRRRNLFAMGIAVVVCLAIGAFGAWNLFLSDDPADGAGAESKSGAAAQSGAVTTSATSTEDPAAAWDYVERQTSELFRDGDEFQERVERLWDSPPSPHNP
ncbi:MAG: hypothetical protein KY475_05275 [Planctomycetes bacterium]|nr:hypothetical protein [Planctomycetota bacterium]